LVPSNALCLDKLWLMVPPVPPAPRDKYGNEPFSWVELYDSGKRCVGALRVSIGIIDADARRAAYRQPWLASDIGARA
jgi:hypothetical protein